MKTKNKMKTVLSIIVLMLMNLGFAQSNYLKITRSNAENDFIKYPPKTTFKLKDENNKVVFSDTSSKSIFKIDKAYTLVVNPPYKSESNIYKIREGKIEIKSNEDYYDTLEARKKKSKVEKVEKTKDYGYYEYDKNDFTNGLTMKKTIENSKSFPERYNAVFEFNNGVIATYMDGEMTAVQNNTSLKVKSKYLIYSTDGLIKLSFRPKTGETWWVFKPIEK